MPPKSGDLESRNHFRAKLFKVFVFFAELKQIYLDII